MQTKRYTILVYGLVKRTDYNTNIPTGPFKAFLRSQMSKDKPACLLAIKTGLL